MLFSEELLFREEGKWLMSSEQGAKHKERFQREQAPAANQPVACMFLIRSTAFNSWGLSAVSFFMLLTSLMLTAR